MDSAFVFFILILAVICFVPYIVGAYIRNTRNEEIRRRVFSGAFISAEQFERDRLIKGFAGRYGSYYSDTSGCYIILIFSNPVTDGNFQSYKNGYIGQSVTVISRVHNHLTGKGNGDVYADRKNGLYIYVRIITCPVAELNDLEVKLIGAFDWNRLYNRSKGGGSKHEGIPDRPFSGHL